jgi:hypothetical protein
MLVLEENFILSGCLAAYDTVAVRLSNKITGRVQIANELTYGSSHDGCSQSQ